MSKSEWRKIRWTMAESRFFEKPLKQNSPHATNHLCHVCHCFRVYCPSSLLSIEYLFILAVPSFSCGLWSLLIGPWPGIQPGPLHWEHAVLASGPPGQPFLLMNYACPQTQCTFLLSFKLSSLCS